MVLRNGRSGSGCGTAYLSIARRGWKVSRVHGGMAALLRRDPNRARVRVGCLRVAAGCWRELRASPVPLRELLA